MKDILADISTWSILKWVILVLIAGFIGQFGKMLAEAITARIRRRRESEGASPETTKTPEAPQNLMSGVSQAEIPSRPDASVNIPDKKALKALAKARKKEAKKKSD